MTTECKQTSIDKALKEWEVVKLRDVILDIADGGTPSTKIEEYFNGDIPWVNIKDIKKDIYDTRRHLSELGLRNSSAKLWNEGTLIFSFGASIGKVGIARVKLCTKQGIAGIVLDLDKVDNEFLYYVLLKEAEKIKQIGKSMGSTIREVRPSKLKRLVVFPLPPLLEQRKIAQILSTVDLAIGKVDEVIAKTERLKKGLMQELLTKGIGHKEFKDTKIGKIPKEWQVVRLKDVAELESGGTPSRKKPEYWNGNIPWFRSGELNDDIIYNTEEKITELGLRNSSAKVFPRGTLLMALYGRGTVSKTAILGIDATTNQAIGAITPIDSSFDARFMQYYLIFSRNKLLNQLVYPSSDVGRTNIYLGSLKLFKIALSSLQEQQKIAEILSAVDKKLELEKREKAKLEKIKRALMDLLLTGKVRVKVTD